MKASITVSAAWTYLGFNIKVIKLGYNTMLVFSRSMLLELCVYICVHACMPVRVCEYKCAGTMVHVCRSKTDFSEFDSLLLPLASWD